MEIEVGEYIRTDCGYITKSTDEYFTKKIIKGNSVFGKAVKHSKNIIDLIELGDIVECMVAKFVENGTEEEETIKYEVVATKVLDMNGNPINEIGISGEEGPELISFENVRSVLTHEQFEKNCYRLEE